MNDEEMWRRRAAHHEAAHAVAVVALREQLNVSLLTDRAGTVEGYTGWKNRADPQKPGLQQATFTLFGPNAVIVLYAGQFGEQVLACHDREVVVPPREPKWGQDNDQARLILEKAGFTALEADDLRAQAISLVRRFWRAIRGVAAELLDAYPDHGSEVPDPNGNPYLHPDGTRLKRASRVLSETDVAWHVQEVCIAEAAYLRWCGRNREPGDDIGDWIDAKTAMGL